MTSTSATNVRTAALAAALAASSLPACSRAGSDPAQPTASAAAPASVVASAESPAATAGPQTALMTPSLAPGEPVDSKFAGCALSCGAGANVDRSAAHVQPGAEPGDLAFCPVSGAVFRITGASPRRVVAGKPLFFCCEACATYFSAHSDEVLQRRGIPQT